jgi:3-dehydroquinate dehydratase-2
MTRTIMVLNGPNLNLLGVRQPHIYGHDTLADIEARLVALAEPEGFAVDMRQSNSEGTLVDHIHDARTSCAGMVINPAGYTHTSVALRDACLACDGMPIVELHLSNPHAREDFRHHSFIAPVVMGTIAGFGAFGYELALQALMRALSGRTAAGTPNP